MISQQALTNCIRLMPSIFRISNYGRCAFTGTLSFVSGLWGVIFPHLYTGGTITFLHPYTAQSWVDHIVADHSTFTYAPTPYIPRSRRNCSAGRRPCSRLSRSFTRALLSPARRCRTSLTSRASGISSCGG